MINVLSFAIGILLLTLNYLGFRTFSWYSYYAIYLLLLFIGVSYINFALRDFVWYNDSTYGKKIFCIPLIIFFFADIILLYNALDYIGSIVELVVGYNLFYAYLQNEGDHSLDSVFDIYHKCIYYINPGIPITKYIENKQRLAQDKAIHDYKETDLYKEKSALLKSKEIREKAILEKERARAKKRIADKKAAQDQYINNWMTTNREKDLEWRKVYFDNHKSKFNYGSLSDSRDWKTYKTIQVGNMVWMAQPLALQGVEDYDWATAMGLPYKYNNEDLTDGTKAKMAAGNYQGIAPEGWHIPSKYEFKLLLNYIEEHCECSAFDAIRADGPSWTAVVKSIKGTEIIHVPEGKDIFGLAITPRIESNTYFCRNFWTTSTNGNLEAYALQINENSLQIRSLEKAPIIYKQSLKGFEKIANIICVKNLDESTLAEVNYLRDCEIQKIKEEEEERHRDYLERQARRAAEAAEQERDIAKRARQDAEEAREEQRYAAREAEERAKREKEAEGIGRCKYCGKIIQEEWKISTYCRYSPTNKHILK